jgi:hypothetical protein
VQDVHKLSAVFDVDFDSALAFARVARTLLSDAFDLDFDFEFRLAPTTAACSTVEERRFSAA